MLLRFGGAAEGSQAEKVGCVFLVRAQMVSSCSQSSFNDSSSFESAPMNGGSASSPNRGRRTVDVCMPDKQYNVLERRVNRADDCMPHGQHNML